MKNTKILFATAKLEKYRNIVGQIETNGFPSVAIATNGDEVLKHLHGHAPGFLLLDASLPILDGFQLCRIMRSAAYRQWKDIPVVLLSEDHENPFALQLAKSVGAYGILHAPFAPDDLLLLIHSKLSPERVPVNRVSAFTSKAKVLISSNDPDTVKKLQHSLDTTGYEVADVPDTKEIIHALKVERPQIFFFDGDISAINGLNILRQAKKTTPEIIIIGMTGHGSALTAIELLKAGADDYFPKPFDDKMVSDICEDALKKHHMNLVNRHLAEAELKLHSMVEGMVDGVIAMDTHGKITLMNRTGSEMLKYLDIQRANDDAIISLNNISIKDVYNEIFIKKQRYISFEIHTKGNEEKYFIVVASPITGVAGGETGVIIVLRDVTREYQLQYQVIKSERLHAVSNLIAGAAHELNNPLAGIQLCTDLVLNEPSISEKAKKYLNRIQKENEQIQSVIKSLLTLTGNYTLSKEQVNVNDIIEELIEQKTVQFGYANIKAVKLLDENLPAIFLDKNQMRRVFLNIVENACISMAEAENEKCLTIRTEGHRDMVKIMISDTGPGIPQEYLTKIFEPFFTAKNIKSKKGTGLGLSIAYSIVHQHNGGVYAKSELGAGATFVIELPTI